MYYNLDRILQPWKVVTATVPLCSVAGSIQAPEGCRDSCVCGSADGSTTITTGWVAMKPSTGIHGSLRMHPNDFGDTLTFHPPHIIVHTFLCSSTTRAGRYKSNITMEM